MSVEEARERRPRDADLRARFRDRDLERVEQLAEQIARNRRRRSAFVFVICQKSSKRIVSATASRLVVGEVMSSGVVVGLPVGDAIESARPGIGIFGLDTTNESPLIGFRYSPSSS